MTLAIPPWFANVLTVLVCGAALWKGGREERVVGLFLALSIATTDLFRDLSWPRVQLVAFLSDLVMLALLFGLSFRTKKYWPLAAAAFQLLAVMTHVAKMIDPLLQQWAYLTAIIIWTYLIFIALGVGTWNHWRANRRAAHS